MEHFTAAFTATANFLAYAAGVVAAILIPALAILLFLGVMAWCFDSITDAMARRWHKRGKKPRSSIGQFIYDHYGDV